MADKDQDTIMASVPELPPEPRENLISTAVKFLLNDKVRPNPLTQKKAFLKKKDLTDEEIEIAIDRSGTRNDVPTAPATVGGPAVVPYQSNQVQIAQPLAAPISKWIQMRDYLATAIIIGGVSYGLYQLIKKFLYPYLFGPSEEDKRTAALQKGIDDLSQNVVQVLIVIQEMQKSLQQQQDQLKDIIRDTSFNRGPDEMRWMQDEKVVSEIKTEITSLKGLLLNRKQFPSTPVTKPVLPSWQLTSTEQNKESSSASPVTTDDVTSANSVSLVTESQKPDTGGESLSAADSSKPHDQSDVVNGEVVTNGHSSINEPGKDEEQTSQETITAMESDIETLKPHIEGDTLQSAASPVMT